MASVTVPSNPVIIKTRFIDTCSELYDIFENQRMLPTRRLLRINGTSLLTWFIDDNDNRFVEITSSTTSHDFLLVARDEKVVESVVLDNLTEIVEWVKSRLNSMAARSPGGRS